MGQIQGGGEAGRNWEQKKRKWSGSVMGEKALFSIKKKINVKKLKIIQHIILKNRILGKYVYGISIFLCIKDNFVHKNGIWIDVWNLYFFQRKLG